VSPRFSDALLRVQSDDRLVVLARSGHERAFVAIVERYRRPLHAFARRMVGDGRVEDVLQQAFVSAWTALNAGAEVRHLRGWLHQIVRNAAIAAAVGPGEDELSDTLIGADGPQAEVERRLEVRETLRNVARLPDRQRRALVGTAMEGRSREEIAASLGLSEGAVRGLVHRARTTLRAAASALTPLPVATWAAAGAGAGSAAGLVVKAGTAVVVSGAVATSVATDLPRLRHHHHRAAPVVEGVVASPPATTPASHPRRAAPAPARAATVAPTPAPTPAVRTAPAPRPQPAVRREHRVEDRAEPREGERREERDARHGRDEPTAPVVSDDGPATATEASDDGGDRSGSGDSSDGGAPTTGDDGHGSDGGDGSSTPPSAGGSDDGDS